MSPYQPIRLHNHLHGFVDTSLSTGPVRIHQKSKAGYLLSLYKQSWFLGHGAARVFDRWTVGSFSEIVLCIHAHKESLSQRVRMFDHCNETKSTQIQNKEHLTSRRDFYFKNKILLSVKCDCIYNAIVSSLWTIVSVKRYLYLYSQSFLTWR